MLHGGDNFMRNNLIYIIIFSISLIPLDYLTAFSTQTFSTQSGYGGSFAELNHEQESSFLLSKITFESDVPLSEQEFFYLTGLKASSFITKKKIDLAYKQLMIKRRFTAIDIDCSDYDTGKHIHFKLLGNWIVDKLSFSGITFGKQKYTALYAQHPGDTFDSTVHEESIKAIKKELRNEGYFDCTVVDELLYSKKSKSITINIKVKRKKSFRITDVNFELIGTEIAPKQKERLPFVATSSTSESVVGLTKNIEYLTHLLSSKYKKPLLDIQYTKKKINKQIAKIRELLKRQGFFNSRIIMSRTIDHRVKTVALVIKIYLGKRKIIKFEGNTLFTEDTIKKEFLGEDQPDWLFSPDIITEQILHEYYKKGFWHTSMNYKKYGSVGFLFKIKEGSPVIINSVEVTEAKTGLPEAATFFWDELLKHRTFDQEILETCMGKLKNFYLSHGFWDFKIIEQRFMRNKKTGMYTIQLSISKEKQRFWGGFEVEGFKELETAEFFKKYTLQTTELVPFNSNWLQEQRVFLMSHFQKKGYWYVDVQPELLIFPVEHIDKPNAIKIVVRWKIHLGKRVKFGKVIVRGNTKLSFKRIMKELKFKKGDVWSREKLDLTRKKLKRLDLFKSIQLQPHQLASRKSHKPVILTLIDDDPVELRLRAGYFLTSKNFLFKRQSTPKFGASLVVKNPTNRADKLSVNADWTRFDKNLNFAYQQPSPFDFTSAMGQFKGFANKYVQPVQVGESGSAYEATQYGFLFGLSDEYKQDYHWGLNIGNEWLRTTRVRGNLNLDPAYINKTLPYFFIEPTLIIDKLDDRVNTKKGTLGFYSLKTMFPENKGDISARLMIDQSAFYPVYNDVILAARIRFGHIFRRRFDHIMPSERFYLGGPYSVRGYEKDALPPLGKSIKIEDGKPKTIYTIQGGSSMINGNLELRFPLYKSLGMVLFQDVGALSQSGLPGFKGTWFPSSGFGLRYKTPIGAFRFDIGWKWKTKLPGESSYTWYLTLGEAF